LEHPIVIDYLGFNVPNIFLLGFGLDYDGLGRNLPEIYQLVEDWHTINKYYIILSVIFYNLLQLFAS